MFRPPHTIGRGSSLDSVLLFLLFSIKQYAGVGMWESRVLGEISKALWKPFCGFHRAGISTAVRALRARKAGRGGWTLADRADRCA